MGATFAFTHKENLTQSGANRSEEVGKISGCPCNETFGS